MLRAVPLYAPGTATGYCATCRRWVPVFRDLEGRARLDRHPIRPGGVRRCSGYGTVPEGESDPRRIHPGDLSPLGRVD